MRSRLSVLRYEAEYVLTVSFFSHKLHRLLKRVDSFIPSSICASPPFIRSMRGA
jgi:hypothetical protein